VRRRPLLLAALALAAAAPTATAATPAPQPDIGFGEQRWGIFVNPYWQRLGLKDVRLVVGWDALQYRWQRREIDAWMKLARRANARVLVAFTRSRVRARRKILPTRDQYELAFSRFLVRYGDVDTYLAWNEANHCSQPTCHRPDMAAAYFDVMRMVCETCTIVAADVLDQPGMAAWLREFRRHVRHRPQIWGLHNYLDANRFRTTGTRSMLRAAVEGEVWFTETGGLVERRNSSPFEFPDSPAHAAQATEFVLDTLARLSPRIRRVYLYHWQYQGADAYWDSGMMDRRGRPRPAYQVLVEWLSRAAAKATP